MQYKTNTKIIIDKRKLDILLRIGCPDSQLLELIKTGKFTRTGDSLIDDTLECLIDLKDFSNWGGKRNGAGRKKKNQVENQVENQDAFQVVDKDIDIDKEIDKDKSIKERGTRGKPSKENEILFNEFWSLYVPVKCKDGRYTDKGSKQMAFKSFCKALGKDSYENIKNGLARYLKMKYESNSMTANVSTFLNQERWKDEFEENFIIPEKKEEKSNFQQTKEMMNRLMKEDWS